MCNGWFRKWRGVEEISIIEIKIDWNEENEESPLKKIMHIPLPWPSF